MSPNKGGEENFWDHTFSNLAKYSTLVKEILYEVDEEAVPGYIKKINGNTIINELDDYTVPLSSKTKRMPPFGSTLFRKWYVLFNDHM